MKPAVVKKSDPAKKVAFTTMSPTACWKNGTAPSRNSSDPAANPYASRRSRTAGATFIGTV
ncbi:hypothetical protein [Subtercola frigoramans]|uniref:Uncharacterized protein n=1 Tax=Subtercola frigoramans TaxID=120298 RepID=A0ABS2L397_9MICO|nr:hypothetical protein [Subtercola frigoramans]MBM7471513.1 hypothetical protein [Subtercola frigoramans]